MYMSRRPTSQVNNDKIRHLDVVFEINKSMFAIYYMQSLFMV